MRVFKFFFCISVFFQRASALFSEAFLESVPWKYLAGMCT